MASGDVRVVVIGAGVGGLVSAILLAAQGCRVTIVEKEPLSGGKVRQVMVGAVPVDAGPTVFTMRDVFEAVFDAAGANLADEVAMTRAEIVARHAWGAEQRLDLHADPDASADAIGAFAGAEAERGYRAFAAESARIFAILENSFLRNSRVYPPGLMWRIGPGRIGALRAIRPYESLWSALGGHFTDPRLRQLFGRYATYCGSSPFHAPATLMLVAHTEATGVWLIEGGLSALAAALERVARRLGVTFRLGETVAEINIESGRAAGVVLVGGERVAADAVVANADPAALSSGRFGAAARRAVRAVPDGSRSLSAITWMMQGRAEGFPLDRHNVFFSSDYPAEFAALRRGRLAEQPSVYLCALDRGGGVSAPDRQERVQIIVNAPADGDRRTYTAQEIERCSAAMQARLTDCGLSLSPDTEPVVATPNTFETLFPSTGGALYGRASHGWAASFLRQSSRTRIPGLYCAGGSTHPGAGVPMAALSGQLAAATLLQDRASTGRFHRAAMPGGMSTRSARTAATG